MTLNSNILQFQSSDQYKNAVDHYLSPKRKDSVKTKWENPFSRKVIGRAIEKRQGQDSDLRVVDLGAGIGEGFMLIKNALNDIGIKDKNIQYLGLDNSKEMVKVGKKNIKTTQI